MINKETLLEAMRNEIIFAKKTNMPQFVAGLVQALEVIENQEEVDSIQIVHCKDCKFWVDYSRSTNTVKKCEMGGYAIGEMGYCAYGIKRVN